MKKTKVKSDSFGTNVPFNNVSRETILTGTSLTAMYKLFRADKMSQIDSLYNAAYLTCHNKYELSNTQVKNKYVNIHEHPIAWAHDKIKLYKHNRWSYALKSLNVAAKVIKGAGAFKSKIKYVFKRIKYIPKSLDNSLRASKTLLRIGSKAILPLVAIIFTAYVVFVISNTMSKNDYSLGVYIDGEYVGNTLNLSEIVNIKHSYESNLTTRYGTPVVLECKMDYLPQKLDSSTLISSGDVSIFDTYLKNYTEHGYGLYIDNKLAAVTYVQKWFDDAVEESIAQQKSYYMAENSVSEEEIDKFVYNNNITIIADSYPKSYFLSQSEVRQLFALPELQEFNTTEETDNSNNNTFTSKLDLDYSNLNAKPTTYSNPATAGGISIDSSIMSGAVTIDIAMMRDESVKEVIPYDTEYVYDENLPDGTRRLISNGKDGQKIIHYKSTYQNDKLVKQEIAGEEIIKKPVNKVIRLGTRELTEDEKGIIPTGTYIYPYNGNISSYYGWRKLRGQNNFHKGLDIYGPLGEPVVASDGGEVIEVAYNKSYGKYIIIQHDEDTMTRYAHCNTQEVEVGQFVAQGELIGTLGNTGNSTGVHVHFEIIENGVTVNPYPLLPER